MSEARESVLHQQALIVMGLFTGFAITTLVVILQTPATFHVAVWPLSGEEYFRVIDDDSPHGIGVYLWRVGYDGGRGRHC